MLDQILSFFNWGIAPLIVLISAIVVMFQKNKTLTQEVRVTKATGDLAVAVSKIEDAKVNSGNEQELYENARDKFRADLESYKQSAASQSGAVSEGKDTSTGRERNDRSM